MPIGKNSISRVKKNGYANIQNTAPDMEDSVILEKKTAPVSKKQPAKAKPKTEAKATAKAAPAPKAKAEVKAAVKAAPTPKAKAKRFIKVGEKLPAHLL